MIYQWLSDLIGYTSTGTGQNSTLIQASVILVVMMFIITVDLIYNLISNLCRKRR